MSGFHQSHPHRSTEADGTYSWNGTTLVIVEASAGGVTGLGYTYGDKSIVALINDLLVTTIKHYDAHDPPAAWRAMTVAVRNLGRDGLAATAISALDTALWDLKAKLLNQPLTTLFGRYRNDVPIYGSGGFTTYSDHELADQLARWVNVDGCGLGENESGHATQSRTVIGSRSRRRRSIIAPCSLMPTGRSPLSRLCVSRSASPRKAMCDGSRSLSPPMTSAASLRFASAPQPRWRSPPANMVTISIISETCWRVARLMSSKPT